MTSQASFVFWNNIFLFLLCWWKKCSHFGGTVCSMSLWALLHLPLPTNRRSIEIMAMLNSWKKIKWIRIENYGCLSPASLSFSLVQRKTVLMQICFDREFGWIQSSFIYLCVDSYKYVLWIIFELLFRRENIVRRTRNTHNREKEKKLQFYYIWA